MTEKKTDKNLKDALVETVQIVTATANKKEFFQMSKSSGGKRSKKETKQSGLKSQASQMLPNDKSLVTAAPVLMSNANNSPKMSSCEKVTTSKPNLVSNLVTPTEGLFERSSIDNQMLEIQCMPNQRSFCCNSSSLPMLIHRSAT